MEPGSKKSSIFTSETNEGRRNVAFELFIKLTPHAEIELPVSDPSLSLSKCVCMCLFPSARKAEKRFLFIRGCRAAQ